jgi:hypothetical protein
MDSGYTNDIYSQIPSSYSYLERQHSPERRTSVSQYQVISKLEDWKESASKLSQEQFPISSGFDNFLTALSKDKRFLDTKIVSDVRRLFSILSEKLNLLKLPDPQALPVDDEFLSLAWELGEYQFTIDIFPNDQLDWFWRNKQTGDFDGEEAKSLANLSEKLIAHFQKAIKIE